VISTGPSEAAAEEASLAASALPVPAVAEPPQAVREVVKRAVPNRADKVLFVIAFMITDFLSDVLFLMIRTVYCHIRLRICVRRERERIGFSLSERVERNLDIMTPSFQTKKQEISVAHCLVRKNLLSSSQSFYPTEHPIKLFSYRFYRISVLPFILPAFFVLSRAF
jgi:hypothetical protein